MVLSKSPLRIQGSGNSTTVLSADEFSALINADHTVVDLATYLRDGSRCFAAIVEPSEGDGSVFFPSLSPEQIRPTLGPRGVAPTKARAFHEGPAGWRLAVIAEHARGTSWSVLVDFDADDVSERLERTVCVSRSELDVTLGLGSCARQFYCDRA
jgi:hypothetical protein